MGVQTVIRADVMQRFSNHFNVVLNTENHEFGDCGGHYAVDVSGHETNIRVIQGTTVMTISLSQYSPVLFKRCIRCMVSLIAIVLSMPFMIITAIAIKLGNKGPVF